MVERAIPPCVRSQPPPGPSPGTDQGQHSDAEWEPRSCTPGLGERGYLRSTEVRCGPYSNHLVILNGLPPTLRLPGRSQSRFWRLEHHRASSLQPGSKRVPTATYPPCPAQDSPGPLLDAEFSLASPPIPTRNEDAEAGRRAQNQSDQTQSTFRRTQLVPAFGKGEKKHGWRQTPVIFCGS